MTIEPADPRLIRVEVVMAWPASCERVLLVLPEGSSVAAALSATRVDQRGGTLPVDESRLGIFGRLVSVATVLADGDRLELLRPLVADPKQARRDRARGNLPGKGRGLA